VVNSQSDILAADDRKRQMVLCRDFPCLSDCHTQMKGFDELQSSDDDINEGVTIGDGLNLRQRDEPFNAN
jgi:hypothetical protein